jgi:hypothetical protein
MGGCECPHATAALPPECAADAQRLSPCRLVAHRGLPRRTEVDRGTYLTRGQIFVAQAPLCPALVSATAQIVGDTA